MRTKSELYYYKPFHYCKGKNYQSQSLDHRLIKFGINYADTYFLLLKACINGNLIIRVP